MGFVKGVNLLPATGEWAYDTVPYQGKQPGGAFAAINLNEAPGGTKTDYSYALDQLQAQFPDCATVALVIAWFGNALDASTCNIYPSTTYIGGAFEKNVGGTWTSDPWRCSSLTQTSSGLIALSTTDGVATYGGTPADQSVVRCLQDLRARGLRTVFYPFILMDCAGLPWRGHITYAPDLSSAATAAVDAFLGSATPAQFSRDATNLTVAYSGAATDFTFRRMILHYANLCAVAGGVDCFLLGSELRGLETIRGPAWTKAGVTGGDGKVTWDYPFVVGLMQLADDVRSIFDDAGLTKDLSGLHNLIAYSADWSDWVGFQHPGASGQWPHLDQLYARANIDLVGFDNYLPLSDWTSGGGLDVVNWSASAPPTWPPSSTAMNGLGLAGTPTLYSLDYLKTNIEGGEKFNWFYNDSANDGIGLDPNGTDLRLSLPEGDRLTQSRNAYAANQQLLANKQLRWWWNNPHQAIYDAGDGQGWAPHGPTTEWVPQSKSTAFFEYGFSSCDKATNQPNVFYDPRSTESFTPYWSIWDPAAGGGFLPRPDDELQLLALQAVYDYWFVDGNNESSAAGVAMIELAFCSVWNWDARPFPAFPQLVNLWGDAGNWRAGQWLSGKGPFLTPPAPDAPPTSPTLSDFPTLNGQGWSVHYRPLFETGVAGHVSGRESRAAKMAQPLWEIELTFDLLRMDVAADLQTLIGFYDAMAGQAGVFTFPIPSALGQGASLTCRFDDDQEDLEEFMNRLFTLQSLKLRSVKG